MRHTDDEQCLQYLDTGRWRRDLVGLAKTGMRPRS